jgi:hypothetical protein
VLVFVTWAGSISDADIRVKIRMEGGSRELQKSLPEVEDLLNPLLWGRFYAYNALMSFCYSDQYEPYEDYERDKGVFGGCFKLWDGSCANGRLNQGRSVEQLPAGH